MIKNLRHIGIVIKDINQSLKLYRDLLGFKIVVKKRLANEYINYLYNTKNLKLTYYKLAHKKLNILLEFYVIESKTKIVIGNFNHIAFTVENIFDLYFMLMDIGLIPLSVPINDKTNKNGVMFCHDYDGNLLEFVEEIK